MTHDRKNPFCEFCQRGRMLKRYCKRVRQSDEDDERLIHRPTTFRDIMEADHMFPSQEARGLSDEQSALVVRDRFYHFLILQVDISRIRRVYCLFQTMQRSSQVLLPDLAGFQVHQFRVFGLITRVVRERSGD